LGLDQGIDEERVRPSLQPCASKREESTKYFFREDYKQGKIKRRENKIAGGPQNWLLRRCRTLLQTIARGEISRKERW